MKNFINSLWNPLWLPENTHEILQVIQNKSEDDSQNLRNTREVFHKTLEPLQEELQELLQKNPDRVKHSLGAFLTPRLDFFAPKRGETPQGKLGYGVTPDFRNLHRFHSSSVDTMAKRIKTYWPLCPTTGRPMAYFGYIHLGSYLQVTCEGKEDQIIPSKNFYPEVQHRLHFFIGGEQETYAWNRNAFTAVEMVPPPHPHSLPLSEYENYEKALDIFLSENPVVENSQVNFEFKEVGEPILGFDLEIITPPGIGGEIYLKLESQKEDWKTRGNRTATALGAPHSQQMPRRPLCPNRFPYPRALCPTVNFQDQVEDKTHQLYQDLLDENPASFGYHETSLT